MLPAKKKYILPFVNFGVRNLHLHSSLLLPIIMMKR